MIPFQLADRWRVNNGYADFQVINTGGCENFAMAFVHMIENAEVVGTENFVCWDHSKTWCGGHCWLFDGVLHYDSEALEGVDDWRKLPFFKRGLVGLKEVSCGCPQISLEKVKCDVYNACCDLAAVRCIWA